ncbi:MAG TPA: hypothetical protein VFC90_06775 [Planctomycetota bacterium]|nr:hypothetical protein [Planctomycetota bacterium]
MTWLKLNYMTLAMAIVLSLLTVGLLTEQGENEEPFPLSARFLPEVKAPVGSVEYWLDDKSFQPDRDRIPVTVSGASSQLGFLELVCRPILDESRFPGDSEARETKIQITSKDFDLTTDLAKRIQITPFFLRITYAPMRSLKLPIRVSAADIQEVDSRFRVEGVRAIPPDIYVRLPVDKVDKVKSLAIKPIRAAGQIDSFNVEGRINTDLTDLKDVKAEPGVGFVIAVELKEVPFQMEMAGVPLHLSCPPLQGSKAELVDRLTLKVVLAGPKDVVEKIRPEQVHVYVKVDWTADMQSGEPAFPIRCEVVDEALRKLVRVSLAPGEPILAPVRITKG